MPTRSSQAGIALVVALIFLVIMTLLGVAALANNTLQTRMAFGATETNLAFQSAETALAAGENWLYGQQNRPATGCATASGTNPITYTAVGNCGQSATTAAAIWPRPNDTVSTPPVGKAQFFNETWWSGTTAGPGQGNGKVFGYSYVDGSTPAVDGSQPISSSTSYEMPRYVIEELGADPSGSLVVGQGKTYRIYDYQVTARAYGTQSTTRTVTQSVYGVGFD